MKGSKAKPLTHCFIPNLSNNDWTISRREDCPSNPAFQRIILEIDWFQHPYLGRHRVVISNTKKENYLNSTSNLPLVLILITKMQLKIVLKIVKSNLPNWPKPTHISDYMLQKKSPPQDFIRRTLAFIQTHQFHKETREKKIG